ncbi:DUF7288 family protein [Halorhabdus salina]|uniref:DUF7288 family protein n=1 Tax=Halorhabdus salina TaxID=2750670 RepID=UPI0015EF7185|nr:hypothetical protein [Halorhabdus salina]
MRQERTRTSGAGGDDRGQAFTLEGLIGAILILTALWYAMQVVIITPTTGGTVDSEVRVDLRQQAEDVLMVASQSERQRLSTLVRNWSQRSRTFAGAINPDVGYGTEKLPGPFGELLVGTFATRGRLYNVEMTFLEPNPSNGTGTVTIASQGTPSESAVVATHRVVLYDNMTLTSPSAGSAELREYDTLPTRNPGNKSGYYPVPNAVDGPVYNIVEVRLIVW